MNDLVTEPAATPVGGAPANASTWQTIEATLSVFFAFVLGFCLAVAGGVFIFLLRDEPGGRLPAVLSVVLLPCEGVFLLWLKHALERGDLHPFVPRFALRQLGWPILLRPIVACWWAAHFAVALGFLVLLENLAKGWSDWELRDLVIGYGALALATGTASHCGLMYLLLAVTALWRSERVVMTLWRYRLAIDLAVLVAVIAIARAW